MISNNIKQMYLPAKHPTGAVLYLGLPSGLFPSGFTNKTMYTPLLNDMTTLPMPLAPM
jgi:hypothetical protein